MSGVVWAPGGITTGRYSQAIAIGAGGVLPPGEFFVPGAFTLTVPNTAGTGTTTIAGTGGFVVSDGVNCTLTAAGNVTMLGAQPAPIWPWPAPWPL